jgi:hypothetical protein
MVESCSGGQLMVKHSKAATTSVQDEAPRDEARRVPTEDEVRERAHAIWLADGMPEGREVDHWMRARRELEREAGLE